MDLKEKLKIKKITYKKLLVMRVMQSRHREEMQTNDMLLNPIITVIG